MASVRSIDASEVWSTSCFTRRARPKPSQIFETYWRFAAERQEIFFRRLQGNEFPWTRDKILREFKFTNAYRACDRVSQFLIRNVLYKGSQAPAEVFFRTILFKLFNKVETWCLLRDSLGEITTHTFDVEIYDKVLTSAMNRGDRIYSAAYIMPAACRSDGMRKHRSHLNLLKQMLRDNAPARLTEQKSIAGCFDLLRTFPMMGRFLAYQYAVDLNYSSMLDFSEMEFVVPGPGASAGMTKCFDTLGEFNEADVIRMVTDEQHVNFERYGLEFKSLWGRPLQLIDCQNLFCEVDKYARRAHPERNGLSGRHKIKQLFRPKRETIDYWFPPKWQINDKVENVG
jgi:hypothetical protein